MDKLIFARPSQDRVLPFPPQGVWAKTLGIGDFYFELGVQIVEACWATRDANGGLMELPALVRYVNRRRGRQADPISDDDVVCDKDSVGQGERGRWKEPWACVSRCTGAGRRIQSARMTWCDRVRGTGTSGTGKKGQWELARGGQEGMGTFVRLRRGRQADPINKDGVVQQGEGALAPAGPEREGAPLGEREAERHGHCVRLRRGRPNQRGCVGVSTGHEKICDQREQSGM